MLDLVSFLLALQTSMRPLLSFCNELLGNIVTLSTSKSYPSP